MATWIGSPAVISAARAGGSTHNRPYASPVDVGPAAKANPDVKFVVYHSGYEPEDQEGPYTDATADVGVNRLIKTAMENGIGKGGNIYAELGSTWHSVMSDPTQAAHVLGKLLKQFGPDNVVWGTDSIWYGSPQAQLDAFRTFQISDEFQEKYGYPELTETAKRKILGLTSARLYGIQAVATGAYRPVPKDYESRMTPGLKTVLEVGQLKKDDMSKMKETYAALAIEPDHTRYGWMRVRA